MTNVFRHKEYLNGQTGLLGSVLAKSEPKQVDGGQSTVFDSRKSSLSIFLGKAKNHHMDSTSLSRLGAFNSQGYKTDRISDKRLSEADLNGNRVEEPSEVDILKDQVKLKKEFGSKSVKAKLRTHSSKLKTKLGLYTLKNPALINPAGGISAQPQQSIPPSKKFRITSRPLGTSLTPAESPSSKLKPNKLSMSSVDPMMNLQGASGIGKGIGAQDSSWFSNMASGFQKFVKHSGFIESKVVSGGGGQPRNLNYAYHLQNYIQGVFIQSKNKDNLLTGPLQVIIGDGNNNRLIEKLLREKNQISHSTMFTKSNFQWTQTHLKQLNSLSLRTATKLPIHTVKDSINYPGMDILDAEAVSAAIANLKIFRVSASRSIRELVHCNVRTGRVATFVGENVHVYNHIRGMTCISHKTNLAQTVIKYCRAKRIDAFSFIPKTFFVRLQNMDEDFERLFAAKKLEDPNFAIPLIIKPGEYSNRGNGIVLGYSEEEVRKQCASLLKSRKSASCALVQFYIQNPLLYNRRKFDIRCYALVVRFSARLNFYWYLDGYARTSSFEYSVGDKSNLLVHLTNEAVQVKDSSCFGKLEPGNKVYFDELEAYFNSQPQFTNRNLKFREHVVPQFKVRHLL